MSHNDKRSVHTDALETLGTIISDSEKRDAIHLAVEPIEAGEMLVPGQDVGIAYGKAFHRGVNHVGIVDPFLKVAVRPGQKFWLVVYPRKITSLRHVWTHPDFAEVPEVAAVQAPFVEPNPEVPAVKATTPRKRKSQARINDEVAVPPELNDPRVAADLWLRNYAGLVDADYDEMMYVAQQHYNYTIGLSKSWPDYLIDGGKWEGESVPSEFWDHFVVLKGLEPLADDVWKPSFFSCSC